MRCLAVQQPKIFQHQRALKAGATKGLFVHIFGELAIALL
jgi:hypothetical protein